MYSVITSILIWFFDLHFFPQNFCPFVWWEFTIICWSRMWGWFTSPHCRRVEWRFCSLMGSREMTNGRKEKGRSRVSMSSTSHHFILPHWCLVGLEAQFSTGPGSQVEGREGEYQLPCLTSLLFTLLMFARDIECGPHWISLTPGNRMEQEWLLALLYTLLDFADIRSGKESGLLTSPTCTNLPGLSEKRWR